jgi:hypothetical protein
MSVVFLKQMQERRTISDSRKRDIIRRIAQRYRRAERDVELGAMRAGMHPINIYVPGNAREAELLMRLSVTAKDSYDVPTLGDPIPRHLI